MGFVEVLRRWNVFRGRGGEQGHYVDDECSWVNTKEAGNLLYVVHGTLIVGEGVVVAEFKAEKGYR